MSEIVLVPVRHHSPACARLVQALFDRHRPSYVLIEGPANFNDRLDELLLPHRLPIAIYTYRPDARERGGAYYPFCVYSPEWQAIRRAGENDVPFAFIDRPWHERDEEEESETSPERYADGALRRSRLIDALCQKVGVDDFDALWDTLFEIEPAPDPDDLLARLLAFCGALRQADEDAGAVSSADLAREAFMRERIAEALALRDPAAGPLLVVTGGYHTSALVRGSGTPPAPPLTPRNEETGERRRKPRNEALRRSAKTPGECALTPYSYARLDSLTGYASGMPSPGYYHAIWHDEPVLPRAVTALRAKQQVISTADLIAAEAMARGLAALRGHVRVWRSDLLDGVRSALVKEVIDGETHPLLDALLAAFRGGERGRLAEGIRRPPLAEEIERTLAEKELTPEPTERRVEWDLLRDGDREKSRILHRLRALEIAGIARIGGTDFVARTDLARLSETWTLVWTPEFDAGCIEAAVYGTTLAEAAAARLTERARSAGRDAEAAARALLDAAQMGLDHLAPDLLAALVDAVRAESDFVRLTRALGHLLYLYRFDEAFGIAGDPDLGGVLAETFAHGIWLLEGVGRADGEDAAVAGGIAALVMAQRRAQGLLDGDLLPEALRRVAEDAGRTAAARGAAAGALWSLGGRDAVDVLTQLTGFAAPERLGDFLTGLFTLARETVRAEPALMPRLDDLILAWSDDDFLAALPSLRLAFSFFPPREKAHLARQLLEAKGDAEAPLEILGVDIEAAAAALAIEGRLWATLERYGIRPFARERA